MRFKRNRFTLFLFLILTLIACSKGAEQGGPPSPVPDPVPPPGPSPEPPPAMPTPPSPGPSPVPPAINQAPAIEVDFNGAAINTESAPEQVIVYKEGVPIEGLNIYVKDPDGDPVKFLSATPDTFRFSPIECGDQNLVEARCHFTLIPPDNINDGDSVAIVISATDEPKREGVAGIGVVKRFKIKFSKEAPPVPQNSPPQVTFVTPNPASSLQRIPYYSGEVPNFRVRVRDLDGHPIAEGTLKVEVVGEPGSRNPPVNPAIFHFHREVCNEHDRPGECLFSLTIDREPQDLFEIYRMTVSVADAPPEGIASKVGSNFFSFQFENPSPPDPEINRRPVVRFEIDPNAVPTDDTGVVHLPLFIGTSFGGFQIRVQDPDRDPIYLKLVAKVNPIRESEHFTFDAFDCENPSKIGECLFDMILTEGLPPGNYNLKVTAYDVPTGARSGLPQKSSSASINIELEDATLGPIISLRTLPLNNPRQFEWEIRSITRFPVRDAAVFVTPCANPDSLLFTVEYSGGGSCKVNNEVQEAVHCLGPRTLDMTPYGSGRYCTRIIAVDSAGRQADAAFGFDLILPQ